MHEAAPAERMAAPFSWARPFDVCTTRTYTRIVGFEWDEENKAGFNFRKHGVRLPEAIPVFDDPCAITIADDESDPCEQ